MSRWKYSQRTMVEDCLSIDISFLKKHHYLASSQCGEIQWSNSLGIKNSIGVQSFVRKEPDSISLSYSIKDGSTNEKKDVNCTIPLVKTLCNFGGLRYWFKCPGVKDKIYCGRRVGKLYKEFTSKYFVCRHCYNLTYYLRKIKGNLSYDNDRTERKILKLEKKMSKKGIHRRTLNKLEEELRYLKDLKQEYYIIEVLKVAKIPIIF